MENQTTKKPNTKIIQNKLCYCYSKNSIDMRACGLCYTFCYNPNKIEQCYMCPNTFNEYYTSGYFVTKYSGSVDDCCCTVTFLPCKIPLFFPCLLGSLCNNIINYYRNTNTNYLF
jgi:hypothetical protein